MLAIATMAEGAPRSILDLLLRHGPMSRKAIREHLPFHTADAIKKGLQRLNADQRITEDDDEIVGLTGRESGT